eukprot:400639_1
MGSVLSFITDYLWQSTVDTDNERLYEYGEIVEIINQQNKPEFNGLFARVIKFVPEKQMYKISVFTPSTSLFSEPMEHCIECKHEDLSMIYAIEYYPKLIINNHSHIIKECIMCTEKNIPSQMGGCIHCRSVFYCCPDCKLADYLNHSVNCDFYKQFARIEYQAIKQHETLFEFDNVMLTYDQNTGSVDHYWLEQMNLQNKGIWKRFCNCDRTAFGELNEVFSEFEQLEIVKSDKVIQNWEQYYKMKQMSLESPFAHWMSYLMTIYHILTKFVHMAPKTECDLAEDIVIHLVGVEVELDLLPLFKELLCLLPGYNFHFYLFGNNQNISDKYLNGEEIVYKIEDNLNYIRLNIFKCCYEEKSVKKLIKLKGHYFPKVVIGLNAGICAREYIIEWSKVIQYIQKNNLKAAFTDYCNISILINSRNLKYRFELELNVKYALNPFRSPIISFMHTTRFASITNGFLFGINL